MRRLHFVLSAIAIALCPTFAIAKPAKTVDPTNWEIEALTMKNEHIIMGTLKQVSERFVKFEGHKCLFSKNETTGDPDILPTYAVNCFTPGPGTEYDFTLVPDVDFKKLGMRDVKIDGVAATPKQRDALFHKLKRRID